MAAHSSVLTWEIPRTDEPGGLQSMRTKESERTERLHFQEMTEGRPLGASVQRSRGRGHRFPAAHTLGPQATSLVLSSGEVLVRSLPWVRLLLEEQMNLCCFTQEKICPLMDTSASLLLFEWQVNFMSHSRLCSLVTKSCPTVDCSPPGSSVHGISQARIVE